MLEEIMWKEYWMMFENEEYSKLENQKGKLVIINVSQGESVRPYTCSGSLGIGRKPIILFSKRKTLVQAG